MGNPETIGIQQIMDMIGLADGLWLGKAESKFYLAIYMLGQEGQMNETLYKRQSYTPFHPPPDDIKKEQSNIRQRTDFKTSVGLMVPTRFVGINFYIKGAS